MSTCVWLAVLGIFVGGVMLGYGIGLPGGGERIEGDE